MEKGVHDDGVTKTDWETAGDAMAELGEMGLGRVFGGDGFARGDKGESEIEAAGMVGVLEEEIGDGRWTRVRQGRQKNKLLLAEASA